MGWPVCWVWCEKEPARVPISGGFGYFRTQPGIPSIVSTLTRMSLGLTPDMTLSTPLILVLRSLESEMATVMYEGWADPVVPPLDVIRLDENVQQAMGGTAKTQEFFRLLHGSWNESLRWRSNKHF